MSKYVLTNKAVKDLAIIWNYTFDTWSEKQADKYYNDILKHFESLAKNPQQGKKYSTLVQGLRGAKINKHIVFFRQPETNKCSCARCCLYTMGKHASLFQSCTNSFSLVILPASSRTVRKH